MWKDANQVLPADPDRDVLVILKGDYLQAYLASYSAGFWHMRYYDEDGYFVRKLKPGSIEFWMEIPNELPNGETIM